MEELFVPKTLEEMTQIIYEQAPELIDSTVKEYLDGLDEKEQEDLNLKLKNKKYSKLFRLAITHCSQMVYVAMQVTQNFGSYDLQDFQKCSREFLLNAREDDEQIYKMRLFYLENLDSEAIKDRLDVEEDEADSQEIYKKYDIMITELRDKYINLKSYLQSK